MRDMLLSVRADESIHRDMNHKFAEIIKHPFTEDHHPIDVENVIEDILKKDYRIKSGFTRTAISQEI